VFVLRGRCLRLTPPTSVNGDIPGHGRIEVEI
jgi:hypothetical protein